MSLRHKYNYIPTLTIFIFSLLIASPIFSQISADKAKLEKERKDIQNELGRIQSLYNTVKGQSKISFGQLTLLNNKMELQKKYIASINKELKMLDNEIYTGNIEIYRLKGQLDTLKKQYASTVLYAYKNRSNYEFVNFIFSATNFNDALKRIAYLKSYRNYRVQQMATITQTQDLIARRQQQQIQMKDQKGVALVTQTTQQASLAEQQQEKAKVLTNLKGQEKDLARQLAEKRKRDAEVKNKITSLIRAEIAAARKKEEARKAAERKAETERIATAKREAAARSAAADKAEADRIAAARKAKADADALAKANAASNNENNSATREPTKVVPPKAIVKEEPKAVVKEIPPPPAKEKEVINYLETNKEDIALGANFESSRGRMPWPVDNCYVSIDYGSYSIEGTKLRNVNEGLTISTPKAGAPVKAVYAGTVYKVVNVMGEYGYVVIKHGKYYTTYSRIRAANLSEGANVATGQVIGTTTVDENTGGGILDFMVMIEDRMVNPRGWIRPK